MKNAFRQLLTLAAAGLALTAGTANAQSTNEGLRVGVYGGANYDCGCATMQDFINVSGASSFGSKDFTNPTGFGYFAGVSGQYLFNDLIGATLRASYSVAQLEDEEGDATFDATISSVLFEPGVRVNVVLPELFVMAGGTVAVNVDGKYDYTPADGEGDPTITDADLDSLNTPAFGAWLGFGYDFRLNDESSDLGFYVTPYVEGAYLIDVKEADAPFEANEEEETWSNTQVRGGVQVAVRF